MPMKKQIRFNLDKRKMCFIGDTDLFQTFVHSPNKYHRFQDFTLAFNGKDEDAEKEAERDHSTDMEIVADVLLADGENLGHFCFNSASKYGGLIFFTFENEVLYRGGELERLERVTNALGLTLQSVTQTDVAADVNFNVTRKIFKFISDCRGYDMVWNGRQVTNKERLRGYGEMKGRSREQRDHYPTLYFSHKCSDGLSIRIYDKAQEIEDESHKTYITEHNGFGKGDKMFRLEVSVRWKQFKRWLAHLNTEENALPLKWKRGVSKDEHAPSESEEAYLHRSVRLLGDEAYRRALWAWASDHVVYFRDKQTHEKVSLLDIAT